jgi:predicted actin-binding protein
MRTSMLMAALVAAAMLPAAASGRSAAAPANTTAPTVSGSAKVGSTLTTTNGTWSGSPTSYAYQWQRCGSSSSCTNITGATKQTYAIVAADAGRTLRAVVTAANADGSATANSDQTDVVAATGAPRNTLRPVILGDAFVGQTLRATNGRWTGAPTAFSYQWFRCDAAGGDCFRIGVSGRTYGVRFADVYSTLRVDVTARNANGSATADSGSTELVQPVEPVKVAGNKAPTLRFISLKRIGLRVYARFAVCDDAAKGVTVIERDTKSKALAYVRKYTVVPRSCVTATRSWKPAPRFRTKGRFVVTLRAVDKSGASSKFVSRSLVRG